MVLVTGAAWLLAAAFVGLWARAYGFVPSLFPVLYFLYAKTPVGRLVHRQQLAAARSRPPHRRVDLAYVAQNLHRTTQKQIGTNGITNSSRIRGRGGGESSGDAGSNGTVGNTPMDTDFFSPAGSRGSPPLTPPGIFSMDKGLLTVVTLPILDTNYAYICIDETTRQAVVIDAADASAVLAAASSLNVQLVAALTTHYHLDHAGGNDQLFATMTKNQRQSNRTPQQQKQQQGQQGPQKRAQRNDFAVYGVSGAGVAGATHEAVPGTFLRFGAALEFEVIPTPGHTRAHVCYALRSAVSTTTTTTTTTSSQRDKSYHRQPFNTTADPNLTPKASLGSGGHYINEDSSYPASAPAASALSSSSSAMPFFSMMSAKVIAQVESDKTNRAAGDVGGGGNYDMSGGGVMDITTTAPTIAYGATKQQQQQQ